jgi:hypothetical protein
MHGKEKNAAAVTALLREPVREKPRSRRSGGE